MQSALVWFRRDLRLHDHAALYHALRNARRVHCAFVFDRAILDPLPAADRRVEFIHAAVTELEGALRARGAALAVRHAAAVDAIPQLATELGANAVFAAEDYEPYARRRDDAVAAALQAQGRALHLFKDQVIFARDELLTGAGKPFSVFTPYKNAWLKKLTPFYLKAYPSERETGALAAPPADDAHDPAAAPALPTLAQLGFQPTDLRGLALPLGVAGGRGLLDEFLARIDDYEDARNYPARRGPSYLSVHLRFGTVSVRTLAAAAHARAQAGSAGAATWLSELIWREFYQQLLWHHPQVETQAFRPEYDRIAWEQGPAADALFAAWCEGRTGYPLVDAAMLQLNRSGYMHNRLRMVTASFFAKDLGLDWRRGEAYFARRLNDYDLAANNGGWQWAASTGCDAQPYFRIFNPVTQSEKFDPDGRFIRRYLPQLAGFSAKDVHAPWLVPAARQVEAGCVIGRDYPAPVVDHATARLRTLARYAVVKGSGGAAVEHKPAD